MNSFEKCAVKPGDKVDLTKIDPTETFGWTKPKALAQLRKNLDRIAELQALLAAEDKIIGVRGSIGDKSLIVYGPGAAEDVRNATEGVDGEDR